MLFPWTINFFNTFGKSWTSWTLVLVFFRLLRNRFFPTRSKHEYSPNGFKQTRAEHEQFLQYLPTINLGISQNWWKLEIQKNQPRNTVSFTPFFFCGPGPFTDSYRDSKFFFSHFFHEKKGFYNWPGLPFWGYDVFAKLFDPIIARCDVFAVKTPWNELQFAPETWWLEDVSLSPFGFRSFFGEKPCQFAKKPYTYIYHDKNRPKCRYQYRIHYMDGIWGIYSHQQSRRTSHRDLTSFSPQISQMVVKSKGNHLISGKSRLVKYDNLTRWYDSVI